MSINATLPPTVAEFRKVFPEFEEVSDDQVQFYLDTAMQWVDSFWFPVDAKLGVMYASAHYLSMQDRASGGELTSGDAGSGGGGSSVVDPEVGKIWVKSIRFRDRSVTYDRVGVASEKAASAGGGGSSAREFWSSTPYGEIYLSFRRRNVAHVAVI